MILFRRITTAGKYAVTRQLILCWILLMPRKANFLNTLNMRTRPIQQCHLPACHSI